MEPTNFETIGSALPEVVASSSTGCAPSATASGTSPIKSESEARAWLLAQTSPQAVDEALARSLTSTCDVTVRVRTEMRFPGRGGFYAVAAGCTIVEGQRPDRNAAIRKTRTAMAPPTEEQAEGWLVLLQAATARREESEAFNAAALNLYAGSLLRYPADVAKAVCWRLARGNGGVTWWPTLGELIEECDRLAGPRLAILAALEQAPARPALAYDGSAMDEERRKVVAAKMRALATDMRERLPEPVLADFSKSQATVDETGISAAMRELLKRQQATA